MGQNKAKPLAARRPARRRIGLFATFVPYQNPLRMGFPFTLEGQHDFDERLKPEGLDQVLELWTRWAQELKSEAFEREGDSLRFQSKDSMVGFWYPVRTRLLRVEGQLRMEYEADMQELIKLTLLLVLVGAFLSSFNVDGFLIFSALLTVVFYGANVLFINSHLRRELKQFERSLPKSLFAAPEPEAASRRGLCPACGCPLTPYDRDCPDCGLRVNPRAKTKPFSSSQYEGIRFEYHFKPEKPETPKPPTGDEPNR